MMVQSPPPPCRRILLLANRQTNGYRFQPLATFHNPYYYLERLWPWDDVPAQSCKISPSPLCRPPTFIHRLIDELAVNLSPTRSLYYHWTLVIPTILLLVMLRNCFSLFVLGSATRPGSIASDILFVSFALTGGSEDSADPGRCPTHGARWQ